MEKWREEAIELIKNEEYILSAIHRNNKRTAIAIAQNSVKGTADLKELFLSTFYFTESDMDLILSTGKEVVEEIKRQQKIKSLEKQLKELKCND